MVAGGRVALRSKDSHDFGGGGKASLLAFVFLGCHRLLGASWHLLRLLLSSRSAKEWLFLSCIWQGLRPGQAALGAVGHQTQTSVTPEIQVRLEAVLALAA